MKYYIQSLNEIEPLTLYRILQLRVNVFMLEQKCLYPDLDDKDIEAVHLYTLDAEGHPAAYLRILPPGLSYDSASIGRVVVHLEYRKTGLGKELVQKAIDYVKEHLNTDAIEISAQAYLEKFYSDLGFVKSSKIYLEDNIPHMYMILKF